jgi:hypothetical protein
MDMSLTQKIRSTAAFRAGFVACAVLALGVIGFVADLVVKEVWPDLERNAKVIVMASVKETFFEESLFTQPVYLTQYYSDARDGHKYQTWKLTLKGRSNVHGELEDVDNGNKGVINGYWRGETLSLSYASAASDRPGIGSFILRPMLPGLADKAVTYAGLAMVHECECKDGVTSQGPMLMIPAVLTSERVLPQNISTAFFVKKPVKPDIVWPADIQQTASAQKH